MSLVTSEEVPGEVPPSSTPCVFRTSCKTTYFAQVRTGEGRRKYLGTSRSEEELGAIVEAWKESQERVSRGQSG